MKRREGKKVKETAQEGLSSKFGRMFANVLRSLLIVICVGSVLIGGFFAIRYTLEDNRSSVSAYT